MCLHWFLASSRGALEIQWHTWQDASWCSHGSQFGWLNTYNTIYIYIFCHSKAFWPRIVYFSPFWQNKHVHFLGEARGICSFHYVNRVECRNLFVDSPQEMCLPFSVYQHLSTRKCIAFQWCNIHSDHSVLKNATYKKSASTFLALNFRYRNSRHFPEPKRQAHSSALKRL